MKNPKWLNDAIFYEIYPQSFYDTNGDGIGDINGITAKLDYILSLGCNAIWINPCFDSPFLDAGYDVRDYKKCAPRYGSNEDMKNLINEAHKKGMHILLDLVPSHTSDQHEWFLKSCEAERNEYSDRYIWTNDAFTKGDSQQFVGGMKPRNGCYGISYFHSQPSLNYGHYVVKEVWQQGLKDEGPIATKNALIDIIEFWLAMGFDGYRVDMAACLVKNDIDEKGTQLVWQDIFKVVKKDYPEAAFISERGVADRAINAGFDMDFYLDHGWDGGNGYHHLFRNHEVDYNGELVKDNSVFKFESKTNPIKFFNEYLPRYEKTKNDGYICFMTSNHDMPRPSYYFNGEELKLVYSFMFLMPGCPYLYYGDELPMRYLKVATKEGGYRRTGARTPMQWDNTKNLGFSSADKENLYLPIDSSSDAPTVENCKNSEVSPIKLIRHLTNLRKENDELKAVNNFELLYASENNKVIIFKRDSFIMIFNPSLDEIILDSKIVKNCSVFDEINGKVEIIGNDLIISPKTAVILKK